MRHDSKLSILETLLARVRKHAASPRVAAPAPAAAAPAALPKETRPEPPPSEMAVASAPPAPVEVRRPPSSRPPLGEDDLVSEPPPPRAEEEEEGPSSAPRLREGLAASADEDQDAEQDFQEDEAPIKTPPPESGRQHVAAPVAAPPEAEAETQDELEMDISITVAETTPSPLPAVASEPSAPDSVRAPITADLGREPAPRLAFVSEPEIELHVRPKAPARAPSDRPPAVTKSEPAPPSVVVPSPEATAPPASLLAEDEVTLVGRRVAELPKRAAVAPERPAPPPPSAPPSAPPSTPPPVRLMAQPDHAAAAPVEVWASTYAPRDLRGQVASFVGQNVSFAPKSFGELLDASIGLGES